MTQETCPFDFNFDSDSFRIGDTVSYRVNGSLAGMPFVGTLIDVADDHVVISGDPNDPGSRMRGTRASRPMVEESDVC